jgi:hypothetical protein
MSYFECKYCLKKFKREGAFKKHECESMKRHAMFRTKRGLVAYADYSTWLGVKGFRNYGEEHFMDSKFFVSFIKFEIFSSKIALPCKKKFIEYMVELDIAPKDWANKQVYDHYIEEYETLLSPEEQATVCIETIHTLAQIFECEAHEVFLYIEPASVIQIVQAKKFSPWILLFSKRFKWLVNDEMTIEQRLILGKFIDYDKWGRTFERHPEEVEKMKTYVKALNL